MPTALSLTTVPATPAGGESPPSFESLLSLALYVGLSVFLILTLLYVARVLGQKTHSEAKDDAYESGVVPSGPARLSEPVPFYLVAIFFIVFDVEVIFVVSWAVAYDLLGWPGFFQVTFFIAILFLGLVHLWKTGGLEWGPRTRVRPRREEAE